jgi:hypothetical protein
MAPTQHPKLFVVHQARRPKDLAAEFREPFFKRVDPFGEEMESFAADFDAIQASPHRTSSGKLHDTKTRSLAQLKSINDHRRALDKLHEQINTAMAARPTTKADSTWYFRQRDAVRWFNSVDPIMNRSVLDGADAETIDLLETAPRYLGSKVDRALLTAARERIVEQGDPQIAKLKTLLRAYEFLYNSAEQVVREAARSVGIVDLIPDAGPTPETEKVHTLSGTPVPEVTR